MIVCWLTGNGDMHLKNFSLLAAQDGSQRLSPAYDLICSRLVIAEDPLALPVGGKKDKLTRADWLKFAGYCKIPERAALRILGELRDALPACLALVDRSPLPEKMKESYADLLRSRTTTLFDAA
jgi:serine/threonine-protein kinase HipA